MSHECVCVCMCGWRNVRGYMQRANCAKPVEESRCSVPDYDVFLWCGLWHYALIRLDLPLLLFRHHTLRSLTLSLSLVSSSLLIHCNLWMLLEMLDRWKSNFWSIKQSLLFFFFPHFSALSSILTITFITHWARGEKFSLYIFDIFFSYFWCCLLAPFSFY